MELLERNLNLKKLELLKKLAIVKAKENLWEFCKAMIPVIYTEDKIYLKEMCFIFQQIYEHKLINPITGKQYKGLLISLPPEHCKSLTVQLFTAWCFGKDINNEVITVSYSPELATKFSGTVRNIIMHGDTNKTINYSDVFPNTKIKRGDAAIGNWSLEGRHNSYLATGFNGTVTGMRGNILIIDDPVKNSIEALNEKALEDKWNYYTDTLQSRVKQNGIQIVIQTRWTKNDLIGKLLQHQPEKWKVIEYKAYDEITDTMLCPILLNKENYLDKKSTMSDFIFLANFQQITIDKQGALYSNFKPYTEIPKDEKGNCLFTSIVSYTDTADTGSDYLASIVAGVFNKELYILDVVYTQEPMEITEKLVAEMLFNNNVNQATVESNNGGRGFARNVERILKEDFDTNKTIIKWTAQTHNKETRILINAPWIMEHVMFPLDFRDRFAEAWEHLITYSRAGKNKHDDIEDCFTALAENFGSGLKKEYNIRHL